jgi:hypothetical protein
MALVELSLGLSFVRQDAGIEDDVIQALLSAAEDSALAYLNRPVYETQDALDADITAGTITTDDNPMVVNGAIVAAILKLCAEMYANREDSGQSKVIEMPFNARTLLRPYRIIPGV